MKQILFYLAIFFILNSTTAQVVFCPPGAEWHYNFGFFGGVLLNETIKYVHDSVLGQDTCKVIMHKRFYESCEHPAPGSKFFTLIKQNGDTIFFRNRTTQNTWQILYNFAVQPGQGWTTTFKNFYNTTTTQTYVVNSISYVTINNLNLKRLHFSGSRYVTERMGWNSFLFWLFNPISCDGELIAWALCYQDDTIGNVQLSSFPCDYDSDVYAGINNKGPDRIHVNTFPNPVKDQLQVEWDGSGAAELSLSDISGSVLKRVSLQSGEKVDLRDLNSGVYLVSLSRDKKLLYTTKLIKVD